MLIRLSNEIRSILTETSTTLHEKNFLTRMSSGHCPLSRHHLYTTKNGPIPKQ